MKKNNFKDTIKTGKDALTDLIKEYDYLTDKEKDTVISLISPVIVLAQNKRCKYYERYFRLIPFFDLKLKNTKLMSYSEFKQWHKDNITDLINSSHIDVRDITINDVYPIKTKEYYEHYTLWYTGKRD